MALFAFAIPVPTAHQDVTSALLSNIATSHYASSEPTARHQIHLVLVRSIFWDMCQHTMHIDRHYPQHVQCITCTSTRCTHTLINNGLCAAVTCVLPIVYVSADIARKMLAIFRHDVVAVVVVLFVAFCKKGSFPSISGPKDSVAWLCAPHRRSREASRIFVEKRKSILRRSKQRMGREYVFRSSSNLSLTHYLSDGKKRHE